MPHVIGRGADRLHGKTTTEKGMGRVRDFDFGNFFWWWVVEGGTTLTGDFDFCGLFYRWVIEGGINLYGRSIISRTTIYDNRLETFPPED